MFYVIRARPAMGRTPNNCEQQKNIQGGKQEDQYGFCF
jgi:hypothetical protein